MSHNDIAPPAKEVESTSGKIIDKIIPLLKAGEGDTVIAELVMLQAGEIAALLEALSPELRQKLWGIIPAEIEGSILPYLREQARASIINKMDDDAVVAAANTMHVGELAHVIEELPDKLSEAIIDSLDADHRQRLEASMAYAEGSAGRIMSTNVISVRTNATLATVLRYLRRHPKLPPHTDNLMVTDEKGLYLGTISVADAVTGLPTATVAETMNDLGDSVTTSATEQQIAQLFERRDLVSLAVVDDQGALKGRITVDEALYIIRAQADHALMARAGLKEAEDLFAPILPSAQRRGVWLGINLITVFMAAGVIGLFEEALDKVVALAVLMPIVASMGGIAGSQTLTLTIRGLSLGQVTSGNLRWLSKKEIAVGLLNGLAWSVVVAVMTYLWFGEIGISVIIAVAMVLNLFAASASGVAIPVVLTRMGIDPALSGAVILTTVTDIVGFLSFLGLATLFLL